MVVSTPAHARFVIAEKTDFFAGLTRGMVAGIGADAVNDPVMLSNICEMPGAFPSLTPAESSEWSSRIAEDREGKPRRRRFEIFGHHG
jgi:hypothetical protein